MTIKNKLVASWNQNNGRYELPYDDDVHMLQTYISADGKCWELIGYDGWDAEHDDDQLAKAAAVYALPNRLRDYSLSDRHNKSPRYWPFNDEFWKPCPKDRIRELVKAGALIAAEIDRLQRRNRDGR